MDVTPDGEIVVVGFTDGSVRLYEMDSSVPSDRHGYLLGHIDEQSSQGTFNVHLRLKISLMAAMCLWAAGTHNPARL